MSGPLPQDLGLSVALVVNKQGQTTIVIMLTGGHLAGKDTVKAVGFRLTNVDGGVVQIKRRKNKRA
ncbi:hypothetical protein B9K09_01155 [Pseudomonas sp. M30-35]|nr:hypothetical protein B9K09_01155 [Pseudomonas sp. M30-35]